MSSAATAVRAYTGSAPEPVEWRVLEEIFDAIFGSDVRDLKRWPETMHEVHARWTDAAGVEHEAESLEAVREAYQGLETFRLSFSSWRADGKPCSFEHWPGVDARASVFVQGPPDEIDGIFAPVLAAFPLQRRVVFVSWSGEHSKRVADVLRVVIESRLPTGGEVFFSPRMRPGASPMQEMLERNLLATDAHVVVLTEESAKSPWVTWEAAASWARGKALVPIFVDVRPEDVNGPLKLLAQGVRLDEERELERGISEVLSAVGGHGDRPLSTDELASIRRAATM
jgi:TIR domain-containing protein